MQNAEGLSLEQTRRLLRAGRNLSFRGLSRPQISPWVEITLRCHQYLKQAKPTRGLLLEYMVKMTGLSAPQTIRLIRQ